MNWESAARPRAAHDETLVGTFDLDWGTCSQMNTIDPGAMANAHPRAQDGPLPVTLRTRDFLQRCGLGVDSASPEREEVMR